MNIHTIAILFLLPTITFGQPVWMEHKEDLTNYCTTCTDVCGNHVIHGIDSLKNSYGLYDIILGSCVLIDECSHDWYYSGVREKFGIDRYPIRRIYEFDCGNPKDWPDYKQICSKCGYHWRIRKTCGMVKKDETDTYESVLKRMTR